MATGVVLLMVTFANIFTIIQPVIDSGDWSSTLWMVGGPIFCWRGEFTKATVGAWRPARW